MKLTIRKTVLILITVIGLSIAPAVRAAHATNFINQLQTEVTNRLANTNLADADERALTSANKSLGRNTKTLSADLTALSAAARVLERQFPSNATFEALGSDAVDAYSDEAHAQLDNAELRVGTNSIPTGWSNQLAQVMTALAKADAGTNGVAARAKALAQVFARLQPLIAKIEKRFPTAPVVPFEAPTEMATGQNLTLYENAIVNDQTIFYFHTTGGEGGFRFLHYTSHNPEELGRWTYERLTAKTAVVHCQVDFTQAGAALVAPYNHDMSLTFTSATAGTFTGVNCLNETIQGTFVLE
ncbi:MAG TPA: hypothetical protein VGF13_05145 [Verrucomicrobiae bacterium]|jgi:hypothetical protein